MSHNTNIFLIFSLIFLLLSCSNTDASPVETDKEEISDDNSMGDENQEDVKRVLVFTRTAGFDHNTREECAEMVREIAENLDFDVVVSDDPSIFDNQDAVDNIDIIFFSNTSGNTLNEEQRNVVEEFAGQGGNFISNHAASDCYGHSSASSINGGGKGEWDWYAENVTGCSVRNNPNHTSAGFEAAVTVQEAKEVLIMGLQFPWNDREEWYYWEGGYINSSFTEFLRVSETGSESYDGPRMTAQYYERPDGGFSFYTSMGHAKSKYQDPEFVRLMGNVFEFILEN